jgi:hypothetical protein
MNTSMDKLCDEYDDTELELLADFLRRTTDAGPRATDELAGDRARKGRRCMGSTHRGVDPMDLMIAVGKVSFGQLMRLIVALTYHGS